MSFSEEDKIESQICYHDDAAVEIIYKDVVLSLMSGDRGINLRCHADVDALRMKKLCWILKPTGLFSI